MLRILQYAKWQMDRRGKRERLKLFRVRGACELRKAEYLDREPALKADCVVAQSEGDLGNTRSIKGGTAGYKACPFKHSSVGRVFSRTGFFVLPKVCLLRKSGGVQGGTKQNLDITGRQFKRKNLFIC